MTEDEVRTLEEDELYAISARTYKGKPTFDAQLAKMELERRAFYKECDAERYNRQGKRLGLDGYDDSYFEDYEV